ncbi:nuclear transport factor 2 family protein [Streptomyces sp. NPDC015345]|jgi:3-phenylpropionate/cinnamic acid dioxygenase small subunit|uniref:nuclear transport factor 2 family protein n=1 Tax=Streptomyces sp. NPDC015345 TaxID=3364953 RepID=UPI0036FB6D8F
MTAVEGSAGHIDTTALYVELQQFYGRHMRAMDEGRVADWTGDFTEDAVFRTNARPDPQTGRAAIADGAAVAARKLMEQGVLRRHCVSALEVGAGPDGTVVARTYAQLVRTPRDGASVLELFCTCEDVFVREEGRLRIRHRQVYRDDLPKD